MEGKTRLTQSRFQVSWKALRLKQSCAPQNDACKPPRLPRTGWLAMGLRAAADDINEDREQMEAGHAKGFETTSVSTNNFTESLLPVKP